MSSEMIGEPPKITEDSDLADVIKELYRGRVGRNQKTSDFCIGGALCHYFLRYEEDWNKKSFPFADQLTSNLLYIIERQGTIPAGYDALILEDACEYYAEAIVNANDDGIYEDAWIHVDMFLKEFGID
tara:strand:+ start:1113 stop:1496 length:384 start_codon:yes stop_codon:yes gene_type:complete